MKTMDDPGNQTPEPPAGRGGRWGGGLGLGARMARVAWMVGLLLVWATGSLAAVREVGPILISVGDLAQQIDFYTRVLRFEVTAGPGPATGEIPGGQKSRIADLRLGDESIRLCEWLEPRGRAIPVDSRSHDHWFQHLAIVVRDMEAAYAHLRRHGVRHVSTGPQTLPAWNPNAGGIRAFYFRDPEDHVLEVIWYPPGKGDPRWQAGGSNLFLGIDHTAIVVADTERSLRYYRDRLGFRVAGESENWGVEQEHLNQVFGARLRITALKADHGPGIEFLEYLAPPDGRPLPADARVTDWLAWRICLRAGNDSWPDLPSVGSGPLEGVRRSPLLTRDPDGHLLQWERTGP